MVQGIEFYCLPFVSYKSFCVAISGEELGITLENEFDAMESYYGLSPKCSAARICEVSTLDYEQRDLDEADVKNFVCVALELLANPVAVFSSMKML